MGSFSSLRLCNFRSYVDKNLSLDSGVTIIVGPNGSGKTNIIEALFVLSAGGSFRGNDRDMVMHQQPWFRLEAVCGQQQRVLTCKTDAGSKIEKQWLLDGSKKARLPHGQRLPVVLFEPDHLRLLRESPSHRRDYIDALLSKIQPDFTWLKHQFERVLMQRNIILKSRLPRAMRDDQLFAWDIKFVELAEQIFRRRQSLINEFDQKLSDVYSSIANRPHQATIRYQSTIFGQDYRANLLCALQQNANQDSERGFTSVGPHRDDFVVLLDNSLASTSASRGEIRSLLLSLKIIELQKMHEIYKTPPLLLLDDVFSELDSSRRSALAQLAKDHQTFITTTDAEAIAGNFGQGYEVIETSEQYLNN